MPLRQEVGLPHFSDPEHKVEYDPQLLRDELADAGWEMGEPLLNWGEIWVEASARSSARARACRSSQGSSANRSTARFARRSGVVGARGQRHATTASRQRLRRRRLVALPAVRVRNADPGLVADELDRAAARRIDDRQPAGHRLDHRTRARILDLRVQQEMRAANEVGRVALRVAADELDAVADAELVEQRLRG